NYKRDVKVGDELTMISAIAVNFGHIKDYRRITQTCRVLFVRDNHIGTDCDSGGSASGSIVLTKSGEPVGIHFGDRTDYGGADYIEAGEDNYGIVIMPGK